MIDGKSETNDCAVRCLCNALNISYELAHKICEKAGRKFRCGVKMFMVIDSALKHFPNLKIEEVFCRKYFDKKYTLTHFLRLNEYKKGTFIFRKSTHVFVVKDGIVLDTFFQKYCEITNIWKVEFNSIGR